MVKYIKYPSGELRVSPYASVGEVRLQSSDDTLAFILSVEEHSSSEILMPYLPFAREDKRESNVTFTLGKFASIINAGRYKSITLVDVHSDVSLALINNVNHIEQQQIVSRLYSKEMENVDYLVAPDLGASKKISKLAAKVNKPVLQCTKDRDPTNGKLSNFKVHTDEDLTGKTVCIVDDICDGGGTFVAVAELLKARGATKVILYATHGLFTKGYEAVRPHIDEVWTTDTWIHADPKPEFVTIKEYKNAL